MNLHARSVNNRSSAGGAECSQMPVLRIALNASTLVMGGALQVCLNIIREALCDPTLSWVFFVTPRVMSEIVSAGLTIPSEALHVVAESPSRSRQARAQVKALVQDTMVDAVFTVFGPAYVEFGVPHLIGVADPWVTHSNWKAWIGLRRFGEMVRKPLIALYKGSWYRRANAWVVEAEVAKRGLVERWQLPGEKIAIVPNNCGPSYFEYAFRDVTQAIGRGVGDSIQVSTLSAYYAHKNLELIPKVARWLAGEGSLDRFTFNLTLPEQSEGWKRISQLATTYGVHGAIRNWGSVPVISGPLFYDNADIMFLPTLLETFSANYPEAMAARRPIVTSDLEFARSLCGNAAEYFDPLDPEDAGKALLRVADDLLRRQKLISEGDKILRRLPLPGEKYGMYKQSILKMLLAE
jgi:glycosyltransferase involved in cell wall biosynthesis